MATNKTRKKRHIKKVVKKVSKRVLAMYKDPNNVWGKAKELEKFWSDLSSGKNVVIIYKHKSHKYITLPNRHTKKYKSFLNDSDNDPNILSVLSSNMSQDAYELYLYPKAKSQSVTNVIKNYTKYFKPINSTSKLSVPY
jgi:hypothetical protein